MLRMRKDKPSHFGRRRLSRFVQDKNILTKKYIYRAFSAEKGTSQSVLSGKEERGRGKDNESEKRERGSPLVIY